MSMDKFIHAWTSKSGCWCGKYDRNGTTFGYCSEVLFVLSAKDLGMIPETSITKALPITTWIVIFKPIKVLTATTLNRIHWALGELSCSIYADSFEYIQVESERFVPTLVDMQIDLMKEGLVCTL